MITSFRLFLMLLAPMLAVMLAGLFLVMRTGQADPWLWGGPAFLFLAIAGVIAGRQVAAASAVGAVLCVLLFCVIAAGRAPAWTAALGLMAVGILAALGGAMVRSPRSRMVGGALLTGAVLLLWLGPRDRVATPAARPPLAVLTALPLFWAEDGMARIDAPIIAALRARFDVRAIDRPADLRAGDRLLLAQPRDPGPSGLRAIDSWVRDGGRMLVLADPRLVWPSRLPLGDRRRAPAVSALGPLLDHWGIRSEPGDEGEARQFLRDRRLITTQAAGRLRATAPGCRVEENGLIARCAVGRGTAVVVADADLLDDLLWLFDPSRPLESRALTADTPDILAGWLGLPVENGRRWLRDAGALRDAVRWALLAGIGWAALGTAAGRLKKRIFGGRRDPAFPNG